MRAIFGAAVNVVVLGRPAPPDWKQKSEPGSSTQTRFDQGTAPSPLCLSRKGEAGEATPRDAPGASESRPVARALERRGGAIDRLLGVMAADQHEPDGTAVLHPAGQADRR